MENISFQNDIDKLLNGKVVYQLKINDEIVYQTKNKDMLTNFVITLHIELQKFTEKNNKFIKHKSENSCFISEIEDKDLIQIGWYDVYKKMIAFAVDKGK